MSEENKVVDIPKKTFIQVLGLLVCLMIVSIVLTYVIPGGEFGVAEDGSVDYLTYIERSDLPGVPLLKGIFAPVLVFFSSDGLTLFMLSLFLLVIAGAFQVMNDIGGTSSLIGSVSKRFSSHKVLLLIVMSFLFFCFGAFLGLFEEMLTIFPVVASLCVLMGYDSFTGFLCCIISCGFGFASAITNPFTVVLASELIGVSPTEHLWYRLIIFAVMYALLAAFILIYARAVKKNPQRSMTYSHDMKLRDNITSAGTGTGDEEKRTRIVYAVFLIMSVVLVIVSSSIAALRSYTVVLLIVYFLFGGVAAGLIASRSPRKVFASFFKGFTGTVPTIAFLAVSASIKYILDQGSVLPTIVNQINKAADGSDPIFVAVVIYFIVLVLEFFVSSSSAKAILVMGMLSAVNIGLSKTMMVLLYTFADGYTNLLFPTSPVLLISLSMMELSYFKWIRKSIPLFAANLILVIGFIVTGVLISY